MRRLFRGVVVAITAVAAFTSCQQQKFKIEGSIDGAEDSILYFENVSLEGLRTLDSVRLAGNGDFSFEGDRPDAPDFYVLRIDDQIINLSIDSTETVTVHAQWPDMAAHYEVSGSENCSRIRELALKQQDLQRRVMALDRNMMLSRSQVTDSLNRMLNAYKRDVTLNYIFKQPEQASSYFALFQTLGPWLIFNPRNSREDVNAFAAVATSWDTFYPGALRGQNLHNIAIEGMNNARLATARQMQQLDPSTIVETGVLDLRLVDNKGSERTLTELKGKVILLDFHTFTLPDSPQRILMLRELYNKYHARGLEIYQVSLDADEHFWRQMTLQLPWVCVRDAEGASAGMYNVQTVPEFFLIDRDNQLQKRSSQMKDVEAEINALL